MVSNAEQRPETPASQKHPDDATDERVSEVYTKTYDFARGELNLNREHAAYVADTAVREYIEQEEDE